MGKAIRIGGAFFKSQYPKKLQAWYEEHLGLEPDKEGFIYFRWPKQAKMDSNAYTLWAPFPRNTKYSETSGQSFMINFVVDDLDAVLSQLRSKGVEVDDHIEEHSEGRFGWFVDPEGNRMELWEPTKTPLIVD
jgi:catechol 2,3-dioxygenase-like lactoylglutathione lyase family enzyme